MTGMITAKRRALVMGIDALAVLAAYTLAFLLRFEFRLGPAQLQWLVPTAPYAVGAYLLTSYYFGVNRGLKFCAGFSELADIVKAVLAAGALQAAAVAARPPSGFPRSVLIGAPIITVFCVAGLHAFARFASHYLYVHLGGSLRRTAVIVGTGDLAELVYDNLRSDQTVDYRVAAFVDDASVGVRLHGRPLVGLAGLAALLRREPVDEIVIAVARHGRGQALDSVAEALRGVERRPAVLVAPTLDEMLSTNKRAEPRRVRPADLLNRRVISLDAARITESIRGKAVLISGAGGTIGGELARQVARLRPRKLILLENNATALFYIESELRDRQPETEILAALGDVRDTALLQRLFRQERPETVFHAAAHKHVHQLESNVSEGISNNLLGTYQMATAADAAGAETFILISTDKAVRPTCVMGATKRAAEIVVSNFARKSRTKFTSVRFGNVLGSSGSVMKIFQEQIEKGQPLTLTHPEATRYFMTVEEAVGLVLQASTLAKGGEIFVLNMGEQIKIMDMARRLIWLSGLEPERDVPIRVVGLRPGEKLAEELIEDPLGQEPSGHPDIMVLKSENKEVDELADRILRIELLTSSAERDAMIRALTQLVPTFTAAPGHDGVRVSPVDDKAHGASNN
jgi:FlaA1/EpsC-like NDP-sugar epimerase